MSEKNRDNKNRWRNVTIAFRMSPEENEELDLRVKLCGYQTRQEYIIESVLHQKVTAVGNPLMLVQFRKQLRGIEEELKRLTILEDADEEFIPYGKVTIIQGDPGEGKTTVVLQIIAKLTKGEAILSETSEGKSEEAGVEPINVIYQTAEDGLGDTIKPRLLAAGADCSRVLVIDDQDQPLTMVDARLEEAIIQTKARLVVLDPIQGFLGAGVDMHRANEIRPLMKRISVLAEKYQCAIILIGHMNKNSNGKSSYRGLGSIDFQAAARSVLIVGRVKDEPEIRVICHVKSSLAPEGDAIAFRLDKEKGFHWIGKYDISADDLLSGDGRGQKIRSAKDFLKEILANGSMEQAKIAEEAEERGIGL